MAAPADGNKKHFMELTRVEFLDRVIVVYNGTATYGEQEEGDEEEEEGGQ